MADLDAPSHAGRNVVLALIVLIIIFFAVVLGRGRAPAIIAKAWPAAVGRHLTLPLTVRDAAGVRAVRVEYLQGGKTLTVARAGSGVRYWLSAPVAERQLTLAARIGAGDVAGLKDGPAVLVVRAVAANLRGATTTLRRPVLVRTQPPMISPLTTRLYIHQGGCQMVVYRLAEPGGGSLAGVRSGVRFDGHFFPGYRLRGATPGTRFALFAMPYNAPLSALPRLVARDQAGNQAVANFPVTTLASHYRTRPFRVSDAFIAQVVTPIIRNTPGLQMPATPLAEFLLVNGPLRQSDARQLARVSHVSAHRFYWRGAFLPLPHSAVEARFADHRLDMYDGKVVQQDDHLGYDLASVEHAPIPAANAGRVVWAKYFGIYGNSVLIDHGYGLMSLYGHMNDFAVHPGQMVRKGQIIGHTDSTGLAAGDHLHFSMLLDGVQMNPVDWWDASWVRSRIGAKLRAFGGPNVAPAATAGQ
ncbi:MAG: M23 family metallopeptidase [Terriglobales bacterium]